MTCRRCGLCCRSIYSPCHPQSDDPMMIEEFRPLLVAYASETKEGQTMWQNFCRNYDGEGCSDYENRTSICKRFVCHSKEYREEGTIPRTLAEAERLAEEMEDPSD